MTRADMLAIIVAIDALLEAVVRLEVGYPTLCTDEGIAYPPIESEATHIILCTEERTDDA
jgi:hypothetical protein